MWKLLALASTAGLSAAPFPASHFDSTIHKVESMVWDQDVNRMARDRGLNVVNVTWEDTGRYKNSVWGPNISDMTIGVRDDRGMLHPMPVIRFDNYHDVTADLDPDRFWLRVGNSRGQRLQTVSLSTFLKDLRSHLHSPYSWGGSRQSLWASRDRQVLVSAQACFLPIPRRGEATFTPVIYNYQSVPGDPAVLTIVATREGTSVQVVQNRGGYMSEVLYFNEDGQRAPFTATRLSDFRASGGDEISNPWDPAEAAGLNLVLVIQVPLKQKTQPRKMSPDYGATGMLSQEAAPSAVSRSRSDVEDAVIGHGPVEGPFEEIGGLSVERDTRFPVRVTVQFYKATSNGVATEADIAAVRQQIDRVYADGDYVGSLVTAGFTGRNTEWSPYPVEEPPPGTWYDGAWGWQKTR